MDELNPSELKNKILLGKNIDFKLFFKKQILDIKTSKNTLCIIYGKQSILVNMGEPSSKDLKEQQF